MAKVTINDRKLFKQAAEGETVSDACENMCAFATLITGHTYAAWLKYVPTQEEIQMLLDYSIVRINIEVPQDDN